MNTQLICPKCGFEGMEKKLGFQIILQFIRKKRVTTIREIKEHANIKRSTAHYHVNRLKKLGVITTEKSKLNDNINIIKYKE